MSSTSQKNSLRSWLVLLGLFLVAAAVSLALVWFVPDAKSSQEWWYTDVAARISGIEVKDLDPRNWW